MIRSVYEGIHDVLNQKYISSSGEWKQVLGRSNDKKYANEVARLNNVKSVVNFRLQLRDSVLILEYSYTYSCITFIINVHHIVNAFLVLRRWLGIFDICNLLNK